MSIRNVHGQGVHARPAPDGMLAYPEPGRDDSIAITYRGVQHSVGLSRRASPWIALDLLTMGPGFFVDDIGHAWYNYSPVYLHPDSSGRDFTVSSSNWIGEQAGNMRPELLLLLGIGGWLQFFQLPGEAGALIGPQPQFLVSVQEGVGIDFYKRVELFFQFLDDLSYNGNNSLASLGVPNLFTDVSSTHIAARIFGYDNFFVQASLGRAVMEVDTFGTQANNSDRSYALYSKFPVVGGGLGWAGDISSLTLLYTQGTQPYNVNGSTGRYASLFLVMGLNLRF